jgi:hypothetical protein
VPFISILPIDVPALEESADCAIASVDSSIAAAQTNGMTLPSTLLNSIEPPLVDGLFMISHTAERHIKT